MTTLVFNAADSSQELYSVAQSGSFWVRRELSSNDDDKYVYWLADEKGEPLTAALTLAGINAAVAAREMKAAAFAIVVNDRVVDTRVTLAEAERWYKLLCERIHAYRHNAKIVPLFR